MLCKTSQNKVNAVYVSKQLKKAGCGQIPIKQSGNMNIYEFNQKAELYLEQVTEPSRSREVFSAEALIWGW